MSLEVEYVTLSVPKLITMRSKSSAGTITKIFVIDASFSEQSCHWEAPVLSQKSKTSKYPHESHEPMDIVDANDGEHDEIDNHDMVQNEMDPYVTYVDEVLDNPDQSLLLSEDEKDDAGNATSRLQNIYSDGSAEEGREGNDSVKNPKRKRDEKEQRVVITRTKVARTGNKETPDTLERIEKLMGEPVIEKPASLRDLRIVMKVIRKESGYKRHEKKAAEIMQNKSDHKQTKAVVCYYLYESCGGNTKKGTYNSKSAGKAIVVLQHVQKLSPCSFRKFTLAGKIIRYLPMLDATSNKTKTNLNTFIKLYEQDKACRAINYLLELAKRPVTALSRQEAELLKKYGWGTVKFI